MNRSLKSAFSSDLKEFDDLRNLPDLALSFNRSWSHLSSNLKEFTWVKNRLFESVFTIDEACVLKGVDFCLTGVCSILQLVGW